MVRSFLLGLGESQQLLEHRGLGRILGLQPFVELGMPMLPSLQPGEKALVVELGMPMLPDVSLRRRHDAGRRRGPIGPNAQIEPVVFC